ncbi:unnamed protein product [Leuciscus chuanchicus]
MRISTSKSEAMVLSRKRVVCPLQVGGEFLPQVEEFKYLGVLFTSEGRIEREIDRRIGAASAVMRSLYRSVVVNKELSRKAKLSIYRSIYVPTLTYGHELWVMTERTRSRIQAAEMTFLRRVAGRSLRDRVRSSVTREELRVEPLLLHIERGQLRWLGHLFRMPPGRLPGKVFQACPTGRRPRGRPRTRWRDYVSRLAWERLSVPPEELEEVSRERESLSHAHADGVTDCIQSSMSKFGLEEGKQKLVGFCAYGTNVNKGQTAGVVTKLRVDNLKLLDIHCMAHRLELALLGVLKEVSVVSHVNDTLHLIWKTYHFSPKSNREHKIVCEELESRFYKPKPVKGARWVLHLDRALKVFLRGKDDLVSQAGQYAAVAIHMENLAQTSHNADIVGRGKKVFKTLKDLQFVAFCHFLADVLQEIATLSQTLQKADLILPSAVAAVESCLTSLDYMKTNPLPNVEEIPGEWRRLKRRVSNDLHGKSYLDLYKTLLQKQPYRDEMQNILHLVQILLVPPISSANCERAFSAQKRIKSDVRSSLTSSRLSDLIFISTEGPELQQYDPSSAVERWQEKAIC